MASRESIRGNSKSKFGIIPSVIFQKAQKPSSAGAASQNSKQVQTQVRLVVLIALCVFLAEALVMFLIPLMKPLSTWVSALFDATLLTIMLLPVLFYFVYRPFVQHITDLNRVEEALMTANKELEIRVSERTAELKASEVELRQVNRELSAKAAKLEDANEELSQYAYAVSHDLQAPLRAINNYVSFLEEDLGTGLEGEQKKYLDALGRAVHEADHLVQGLLDLSRIGQGGASMEQIPMGRFLRELINSMPLPAGTTITTADEWPTIDADPVLLKQIFQNLIENAVKFNDSPRISITLEWRMQSEGKFEFLVSDNGIGFEKHYQDQIFRVFERLHALNEYNGTGIGLAIVKKASAILGGTIRVESNTGQGSTFILTLPRASNV